MTSREEKRKAIEEFKQASKELYDYTGEPQKMSRERAIAFISHLTGHGASTVDEMLEDRFNDGRYVCVLGEQVYRFHTLTANGDILLFHSFRGEPVKAKYFHGDSFKYHHELNEEYWEAIKKEIREEE